MAQLRCHQKQHFSFLIQHKPNPCVGRLRYPKAATQPPAAKSGSKIKNN
jgi:hypothetical protein